VLEALVHGQNDKLPRAAEAAMIEQSGKIGPHAWILSGVPAQYFTDSIVHVGVPRFFAPRFARRVRRAPLKFNQFTLSAPMPAFSRKAPAFPSRFFETPRLASSEKGGGEEGRAPPGKFAIGAAVP
jgi:hypothetical protein